MPIIFIHGVNTRYDDKDYRQNLKAREKLIKRYLLEPLAAKGLPYQNMEIVDAYWGKHGVDFSWQMASLPYVRLSEHLGSNTPELPQSVFELQHLLNSSASPTLPPEILDDQRLKIAATQDLTGLIETLLLPVILSEQNLSKEAKKNPEREGELQALLAVAGWEVANDSKVQSAVKRAKSDEALLQLLKKKIQERFEELVLSSALVSPEELEPEDERLERLGSKPSLRWLKGVKDSIGELFNRAMNVSTRALTIVVLQQVREDLHFKITRFLGDVFIYLNERGSDDQPGSIISTVLKYIDKALKNKHNHDEPLIIMTHSMGGNILYDILTHYRQNLHVDVWVSVGGQVGLFEEMKIFKDSNKKIGSPDKVESLKGKVDNWLNVYDPADIFSFKAAPIFADVQEEVYRTGASGLKPHDAYFKRASFYKMLYQYIDQALS